MTGTAGIFMGVLMGGEGDKVRAVSVVAVLRAAEERRQKKKIPVIANKHF